MEISQEVQDAMIIALNDISDEIESEVDIENKEFYERTAIMTAIDGNNVQISVKVMIDQTKFLNEDEIYWKDKYSSEKED